jgi:hypothetical protein
MCDHAAWPNEEFNMGGQCTLCDCPWFAFLLDIPLAKVKDELKRRAEAITHIKLGLWPKLDKDAPRFPHKVKHIQ